MNDLQPVYQYLRTLADIEPGDLAPLEGHYTRVVYKSGDHVFRQGDRFQKVTFILKGLVKKYYLSEDGREFIKEFSWNGQITTPYASLLRKVPATYSMQALEDTELFTIEYALIERLFKESAKWLALGKAFSDLHFLNREDREMELLKYSAEERYRIFRERFPDLIPRLKKKEIASYLGITPVSLSRLESELK